MPNKLRRFAFCVGVDQQNGTCLMVYENDLNAIEVRAVFTGAQLGKWYRFDLGRGARRSWEAVDERLPTRMISRKNAGDGVTTRELIQLCLPIFFVPNFNCFGCVWRVPPPAALNDKMHFKFISTRLELPGQVNFSVERLIELDIHPGEQCFAFLTMDFRGADLNVKPPQWTLDAVEDLQRINVDPLLSSVSTPSLPSLDAPKVWGILLHLVIDSEDTRKGTGAILCLRDGKLAFGRILKVVGLNDCWRAQVGDVVGFCLIDIDFFNYPVRMALNVLSWQSPAFTFVDAQILSDQFPQDALPELPSVRLVAKSAGKVTHHHTFELSFVIDHSQRVALGMGSFRVENLGVLMDMEGELLSAWNNMTRNGADSATRLLARVKARHCLMPEQQQPHWLVTEMLEIAKMRNDTERKQQTREEQKSTTEGNCETYDRQRKWEDERSSIESHLHERFSQITVQDGAFGTPNVFKRHLKCQQNDNNIELYSQSVADDYTIFSSNETTPSSAVVPIASAMAKLEAQQPKQIMQGIVLFTRTKGNEMYFVFYDEEERRFTRSVSAKIIKVPFPPNLTPKPGPEQWFRVSYQNHKTMTSIAIVQIDRLTDLSNLPAHRANKNNEELWDKLEEGKLDEINLWDEPTANSGGRSSVNGKVQQTAQQQQRPLKPKSPQNPIKRSAPVPVTNVFMRKKDDYQQQQNGMDKQQQQPKANAVDANLLPPLLNCSSKFFIVQSQLAGLVVYAYTKCLAEDKNQLYEYEIWPFCTGRSSPHELFLSSSHCLQIGHWLKFPKEDYEQKGINEENCRGLAPWMPTQTVEKNVYIDCYVFVPSDFGANPEAELATAMHKPSDPKTPFIRKLKVDEFLLPQLNTQLLGSECKMRIKYENKYYKKKECPRGNWRITQILGPSRKI